MVSTKAPVRTRATIEYLAARKDLAHRLAEIVHPKTGNHLDNMARAQACFVLAKSRISNREVIEALIASLGSTFITDKHDITYGVLNPADALVAIGKPAVGLVLHALAKEKVENRLQILCSVLDGIEGPRCAIVRIDEFIQREKSPERISRLKKSRKYLVEREQQDQASQKRQ